MKHLILPSLFLLMIFSCKKKQDTEPQPEPAPLPNQVYVKINGEEKKCNMACFYGSNSGNSRSTYFNLEGTTDKIYFGCFELPKPGTHELILNKQPTMIYIKNNAYYKAMSGTLVISDIDTSSGGVINKMVASFNFKTDSASSEIYTITDGSINLK